MSYNMTKLASVSEDIKAKFLTQDTELHKVATLGANEYFRHEIRENGIRRQITPPTTVTADMFDPDEATDLPSIIVEMAPESQGAYLVPFETMPERDVIMAFKKRVEFNRIMTKEYTIDKMRLVTWKMPILDIFYDLMLKDIMDVEDRHTLGLDRWCVGTKNQFVEDLECCRNTDAGPLSREALVHLKKGMKVAPGQLQPAKYLMNDLTHCDFGIFGRDEIGGDMAQEIFVNGVSLTKIMGIDTIITTKRDLVKPNEVFIYTDPKFYGGFYTYEDVSMVTKDEANIWLDFFAHECIGATVVNRAAVALTSFTGAAAHDWLTDGSAA